MKMFGQGATEYLVLLAVVLIVALVSVALLGFFPGMASDAQITQSQAYWQSATPIAIVESAARINSVNGVVYPYIRVRNNGAYPLRITGIIDGNGTVMRYMYAIPGGNCTAGTAADGLNISDFFYLGPGEENHFSYYAMFPGTCFRLIRFTTEATSGSSLGAASSNCQNSSTNPGTVLYKSFGFEYIMYIDNQQITKRQIGKEFIVKCREPA